MNIKELNKNKKNRLSFALESYEYERDCGSK